MHTSDLLEAEGRALRDAARTEGKTLKKNIADLSLGAALLLIAAPLAILGLCLLIGALYMLLTRQGTMEPPAAAAITGLVTLGVAGLLIWMFKSLTH